MKKYLLIFGYFFSFVLQAEIQGIFQNADRDKIKLGSSFKAKIIIWPLKKEEIEKIDLKQTLEGKKFLGHFYIIDASKQRVSENNHEALEVDVNAIIYTALDNQIKQVKLFDKKIPFAIKGISSIPIKKSKNFIVWKQGIFFTKSYLLEIILVLLLIVLASSYYILKFLKKINLARKLKKEKKYWKDQIISASDRKDYESLYLTRKKWGKFFSVRQDFFMLLNHYQYKPNWDSEEENLIREEYKKIKEAIGNEL